MKMGALCYIRQAGKTLMLLRNKKHQDYHHGKWNGLGGKFEQGESPEACMAREVFEESGLCVDKATLRGFITFPCFDGVDDWYVFVYTVEAFSGELRASPEGELHWIDDGDLLTLPMWEGDRIFLPWLKSERIFSAVFRYQDGIFQDHEVVFY